MAGLFIHTSNKLEELARVMAVFLTDKKSIGVLDPEVVVVPSRGLERWLKLYLARSNGISANLEFPFPHTFLEDTVLADLRRQIDPEVKVNPFAQEFMAWKIFFALAPGSDRSFGSFPELDNYLVETGDELSRYHLSLALADLFDRYLLARPELIRAWEMGENPLIQFASSKWQKDLWLALGRGQAKVHFAALHELLNQMIYPEFFPETAPFSLEELNFALPARLFLFGFAALPFTYFDLFKGLSRLTEVHLFHCNPCAEYWGDQYRAGAEKRYLQKGSTLFGKGFDQSAGHPLLSSWGRLGRSFFDLAASLEVTEYNEHFVVPEGGSLLAALQRQILFLEPPQSPLSLENEDYSLQIHRSHGLKREVEILYDNILAALERDSTLEPDDILVMAPDIGIYVPYIEALFSHQRPLSGKSRLAFSLVSSKSSLRLPVVRALLDLLRLVRSRYRLSEVFDLFSQEVICRRFAVTESGLGLLGEWLRKAAVNWGLDGDFRQENVGVDFAEHSFSWGLNRLLAGYGLAGNDLNGSGSDKAEAWFVGSEGLGAGPGFLPLSGVEGSDALILGSFCAFIAALGKVRQRLLKPLPVIQWRTELASLIDDFIQPLSAGDDDLMRLRQAINNLCQQLETVAGSDSGECENVYLGAETVVAALEKSLGEIVGGAGFFAGGITFSSILPLRALPAKMICLLGLNDGEFPRSHRPPAYDLITALPRAGDRNARDEDRYLFLETLLAARKILVLSYIGRDPKDNHLRPPSVMVSELLDYVDEHFTASLKDAPSKVSAKSLRDLLLYDHPPQSFSPRYFKAATERDDLDKGLFSYDLVGAGIAASLSRVLKPKADFFGPPLEKKSPEIVGLLDLVRFYMSPARYFLKERLNVAPEIREIEHFDDSEPFALDALDSYQLYDEMIDLLLEIPAAERFDPAIVARLESRLAAAGKLPLRAAGRVVFAEKIKTARAMTALLAPYCAQVLPSLHETITLSQAEVKVDIQIKLAAIFRGDDGIIRQVLYRPSKEAKDKDRIRSLILHLGLELLELHGEVGNCRERALETRFQALTEKKPLTFTVRESALAQSDLEILFETFIEGLQRPLPFLPALSLPWYKIFVKEAENGENERGRTKAREKVRSLIASENNYDVQDEAFQVSFKDRLEDETFWADFESLAQCLGPIFFGQD